QSTDCSLSLVCWYRADSYLLSFPTRRSSDLVGIGFAAAPFVVLVNVAIYPEVFLLFDLFNSLVLCGLGLFIIIASYGMTNRPNRSEEHTSELQSRFDLVCRLLLEKKKLLTEA